MGGPGAQATGQGNDVLSCLKAFDFVAHADDLRHTLIAANGWKLGLHRVFTCKGFIIIIIKVTLNKLGFFKI